MRARALPGVGEDQREARLGERQRHGPRPQAAAVEEHGGVQRWPSRDAYWSITPVGAPTISFSARCPALASSAGLSSSPHSAASAPAAAISSAAEEEKTRACRDVRSG